MTDIEVLRVFTDTDGQYGNPLGVVLDGAAIPDPNERQQLATGLGYSETIFFDDLEAGRIQIFTPAVEIPFAGHPTPSVVGAAAFAPPPTTATVDTTPVVTSTRYSATSGTLVKTSVRSGHHTGPSGKRTRGTTTTVSDMAPNLSLPVASAPVSGATTNAGCILVVRHGQSTWNAASKRQGQADPPLSPLGVEQSELAAKTIDRADLVW